MTQITTSQGCFELPDHTFASVYACMLDTLRSSPIWTNAVRTASAQLLDDLLSKHDAITVLHILNNRLQQVQADMESLEHTMRLLINNTHGHEH